MYTIEYITLAGRNKKFKCPIPIGIATAKLTAEHYGNCALIGEYGRILFSRDQMTVFWKGQETGETYYFDTSPHVIPSV